MRDIKFRGKSIENGEWLYGDLLKELNKLSTGIPAIVNHDSEYVIPRTEKVNINTVGQYTGLKDKNGVEIYEGDVVQSNNDIIVCRYNNIRAEFACYDLEGYYFLPIGIIAEEIEIIGNIHDNPELIGGK